MAKASMLLPDAAGQSLPLFSKFLPIWRQAEDHSHQKGWLTIRSVPYNRGIWGCKNTKRAGRPGKPGIKRYGTGKIE
jgi:hypothetical protein